MEIKKSPFSEFSNIAFLLFVIFLLSFLWCNFYLKNLSIALTCSFIIIIAFSLIYIPYKINKIKKIKNISITTNKSSYLKNQLLFSSNLEIINFIIELYEYSNTKIKNDFYAQEINKKDIFINFSEETPSLENVYNYYKTATSDKIDVFCFNKPKQVLTINNKEINFIDFDDFLQKCKEKQKYFDKNILVNNKNNYKFTDILNIILNKNRSKNYLWLGILILISSLFTPYNIYYFIVSTILLGLSIFVKFNNIYNK